MKRVYLDSAVMALAAFFVACGDQGGANNKAANAGNSSNAANAANTATAPANTAAMQAELQKLMDATQAALSKNDADALDKIYAENYMTVNQDGTVANRADRLAAIKSGDVKYESAVFSEQNFRFNPEGTGAIGITKLTIKGTFKGKPMDGVYRVTGIYSKTKDGWKLAGSQTTRIEGAADAPKAANSNTAVPGKANAPEANK